MFYYFGVEDLDEVSDTLAYGTDKSERLAAFR